jgi:sugar O-acyltransferase (sialic acid O-acetyltransferase NeuD family)
VEAKPLIIVGASPIAEVAYEYFTHDAPYDVAAFSVDAAYIDRAEVCGVPVVPLEELTHSHPPEDFDAFISLGYGSLNRNRSRFFDRLKEAGYSLASYVSSEAFVWHNVEVGENCFILEHNVLQPFVHIGDNVTLWSGNHIGHHSSIGNHVFVASHVVVSGFCEVGDHCFIGVNATIANDVKIGADCLIGAGVTILRDAPPGGLYAADKIGPRDQKTWDRFGIVRRGQ